MLHPSQKKTVNFAEEELDFDSRGKSHSMKRRKTNEGVKGNKSSKREPVIKKKVALEDYKKLMEYKKKKKEEPFTHKRKQEGYFTLDKKDICYNLH